MDHSKLLGVVAIENGAWFSPFGHEIPAAENLEFVTFGFHHELVSSQQSEIERLRAEVDRLTDFIRHIAKVNGKIHGDMVEVAKAEVVKAHNDAIDAVIAHLKGCGYVDGDTEMIEIVALKKQLPTHHFSLA